MTVHVLRLDGCAPSPLAHYLKALGVLRLVGQQADPAARGFWRGDAFHLASVLDQDELLEFFLHRYAPTPLLAPWNGGSGFYPKDNTSGIEPLRHSDAPRFAVYRHAIEAAAALVGDREASPKDAAKAELLARSRATWAPDALAWLNAAVVLTSETEPRYPALLGTGGNDGRLDFTNNFMQRLTELFDPATGAPRADAATMLAQALVAAPAAGLPGGAIGQFHPGAAGGANASADFQGSSLVNPWDFVLMLEGAITLQVAAVRQLDGAGLPQASAPFAVRGNAADYASATAADESARGEQWMPVWRRPATYGELRGVFREGRLHSGRRRARSALDAARAIARLGVTRGLVAFERFGFIERNGQANLAVPLGRWEVAPTPHVRLLDELDPWLDGLRRAGRDKAAPASVGRSVRRIEAAIMATCREGGRAERWIALLAALGEAEDGLVARGRSTASLRLRPLPPLSPEWLEAAYDGSPELRLAAAIASQRAPARGASGPVGLDPIRGHALPLAGTPRQPRFAVGESGLMKDPRVVWTGRDLASDLTSVALRRATEASREPHDGFPLEGVLHAALPDVMAFLAGEVDDARISRLARALMAVQWHHGDRVRAATSTWRAAAGSAEAPLPLYAVIRLAFAPRAVGELQPRLDPSILRALAAGDVSRAVQTAVRRLRAAGAAPRIGVAVGSRSFARRLAASVAIPVAPRDLARLLGVATRAPSDPSDRTPRSL